MEHQVFQELNQERPAEEYEAILHSYLVRQVDAYRNNPEEGERIAYEIAGLMSSEAVRHVSAPYREVLEMAGQLELPTKQRETSASWDVLAQKVSQLR